MLSTGKNRQGGGNEDTMNEMRESITPKKNNSQSTHEEIAENGTGSNAPAPLIMGTFRVSYPAQNWKGVVGSNGTGGYSPSLMPFPIIIVI